MNKYGFITNNSSLSVQLAGHIFISKVFWQALKAQISTGVLNQFLIYSQAGRVNLASPAVDRNQDILSNIRDAISIRHPV